MSNKLILITGGQKSGKSIFAEKLALQLSETPIYIATARIFDEDFRQRVAVHKKRRESNWINIEEPMILSKHNLSGKTVLIDCVTLWATNFFFDSNENINIAISKLKAEFDKLIRQNGTFIFVTTETGLGGISENESQRKFNDLQGEINQYIAAKADEVHLIVSGIDIRIK